MTGFRARISHGWQVWRLSDALVTLTRNELEITGGSGREIIPLSAISYVRASRAYVHGHAHFYLAIDAAGRRLNIGVHAPDEFRPYDTFLRRLVPSVAAAAPGARMEGGMGTAGTIIFGFGMVCAVLGLVLGFRLSLPERWVTETFVNIAWAVAAAGCIAVIVMTSRMLKRRRYDGSDILIRAMPEFD